jgi:hypothetical protein
VTLIVLIVADVRGVAVRRGVPSLLKRWAVKASYRFISGN